jgi:hypothetical protein
MVAGGVAGAQVPPEEAGRDLFSQADQLLKEVSEILRLPVREPVRKKMTTRDEVREYVKRQMDEQFPGVELDDLGEALGCLGLVPEGFDLREGLLALFTDQVAGYYDPEGDVFYIADWVPESLQEPAMAHELAHALQDQHFDLAPMLEPTDGEQDADMAMQAVVEGQGVAVMVEHMMKPMGMKLEQVGPMLGSWGDLSSLLSASESFGFDATALRGTPPFLVKSLMFPYSDGFTFYLAFLEARSWERGRELYRNAPVSTEQILHPEKYLVEVDLPQDVEAMDLEAALPAGWKVFFRERLGEFTLREMLSVHLEAPVAARAAAGWDGDRTLVARGPDGALVLLQRSEWDTPEDAGEYFRAWLDLVEARHPEAVPDRFTKDRVATWTSPGGDIRIWTEGSSVGVMTGAPTEAMRRLFPPGDDEED